MANGCARSARYVSNERTPIGLGEGVGCGVWGVKAGPGTVSVRAVWQVPGVPSHTPHIPTRGAAIVAEGLLDPMPDRGLPHCLLVIVMPGLSMQPAAL